MSRTNDPSNDATPLTAGSPLAMSLQEAEGTPAEIKNATPQERKRWAHHRWFVALRSFAVFIGVWYLLFLWNGNPIQLPSPFRVAAAFWQLAVSGELFEHALISTTRLVIALIVATLVAVPLGFVMGLYRTADRLIDPVVEYPRDQGISITGGAVYRGKAIPGLVGACPQRDPVARAAAL